MLNTITCYVGRKKENKIQDESNLNNLLIHYLNSAVFGAGGEPVTPVRESQVEDLVRVLSQRLNLHTGDTVKQAPELPVPRHSRCTKAHQELLKLQLSTSSHKYVVFFAINNKMLNETD